MIEALWSVEFLSNAHVAGQPGHGAGCVVLETGRVLGGDHGYTYVGSFELRGNGFVATVKVTKYNPQVVSVFGGVRAFTLNLSGTVAHDTFTASGTMVENPAAQIRMRFVRRAELP